MHEILKFLCYKDLFNQFSHYDLRELTASNRVVQVVYETIKELHDENGSPDGTLSTRELGLVARDKLRPGDHQELTDVLAAVEDIHREQYSDGAIKKAFENAHRKNLAAYLAATALPVLNNAEELDLVGILAKLEDGSTILHATDNIGDYATHTEREVEPTKTIPTFLKPLDDAIDGGLSPGQLGTYVGWPGIGKTLLLHQSAALSFYNGYHSALVTLEISKSEAYRRLDMFFGRYKNPQGFEEVKKNAKDRGGKLTVLDAADDLFTPASVRAFLESQRRRGTPIDILFIDYADLMETGRNLEDYNELGEIYKQLRRISNKFDVPIWTASQAVRGAFNKRWLGMSDIADSFKKARIADLIVTINQDEQEAETGQLRLFVAKSRRNRGHPKLHLGTDMTRMAVVPLKQENS